MELHPKLLKYIYILKTVMYVVYKRKILVKKCTIFSSLLICLFLSLPLTPKATAFNTQIPFGMSPVF